MPRKKRVGRPPVAMSVRKSVSIGFRIRKSLKRKLAIHARKNGVSLSHEVSARLERWIDHD
jgi:predicted HicB family RNase H-like nuclease